MTARLAGRPWRRRCDRALTGGFHAALWVSGLVALAAVPVALLLIRRSELARAATH